MTIFLDICKVIGACSVLAVFGCVLYLLGLEAWDAWKDYRSTKRGLERQLEDVWNLPAREPRRRAL